jgi:hypothetical protein
VNGGDSMPKPYGPVTEKLLSLKPGASCFVALRRLCLKTLRKHAPDKDWTSEAREGGVLVTRVR